MRITTERLCLREFTLDDVPALYDLESRPEVVRYQSYLPRTEADARRVVEEIVLGQGRVPRNHFELAVMLGETFIGRVGAWIEDDAARLWYAFLPMFQGQGYATEAMRAFADAIPAWSLTIECDPRNVASWRLAERLGFARASLTERAYDCKGEWVDSLVYVKDGAARSAEGSCAAPE
jgi:RimJ/RimL family protein N-acetyltransferase